MKSPFKFLDSYTKDDREIFFGREREIEELYHRVFESKIMLVYGVSGTGKSSLIHCGLANKFQDTDWLPLVIRRGGSMPDSLADSIKSASITPQTGVITTPAQFRKAVRSIYLDHYKPVFFVFDQFEELFILGNRDEKQNFIRIIKSLHESDIQCRFIFILREEYMAGITEFEKYIPTIFQNRVRVEKMSRQNAIEAIKGPCKVAGIGLEEGFAESLLEKLCPEGSDVELTYLQVFLDKIFKLAVEKTDMESPVSFNDNLLSNAGDVKDILGSFLDEQVSLLPDPVMGMSVLKAFVTIKGTKRPATFEETIENVRSLGKDITSETLEELIQVFIRLRLLTDKDNEGRYELRHDTLAEKIFEKFSLAEKELVEIKQLIENEYQVFIKRKVLLSNEDLHYISNKDAQLHLDQQLRSFLEESRKHQAALRKTFRRLIAVSALALVILLTTIGYALSRRSKVSNADRYAYESLYQVGDPLNKICLAVMAWQTNNGENSKTALIESFNYMLKHPGQDMMFDSIRTKFHKNLTPVSSPIECAFTIKSNCYIYGYLKDSIIIWDENGKIRKKINTANSPLISLTVSKNGESLAGVGRDSIIWVWDAEGTLKFSKKIRYNPVNTKHICRFNNDNFLVTLTAENDAEILNAEGSYIQKLNGHEGGINGLDISDDGQFIALASSDSTVSIWYQNPETKKFEVYNKLNVHHDTVWSVEFAPNSRYVATTSKDRTVKVTSINNENVWGIYPEHYFNEVQKLDLYPIDAQFDESGSGIQISSSETGNYSGNKFIIAYYYNRSEIYASAGQVMKFDCFSYSPDKNFFAYTTGNESYLASRMIFLTQSWAMLLINSPILLKMTGEMPFFSCDGKYIYTVKGNSIESWFIDVETIARIGDQYYKKWYWLAY
jgi:hypothetical protein